MPDKADPSRQVLAIELALQRYAMAIDTAGPAEVGEFFTHDARLDLTLLPGVAGMSPFSAVGRQDIVDSLFKSRARFPEVTRTHVVRDVSVTFLGGRTAKSASSFVVVASPPGVWPWRWLTVRYFDDLVLEGTSWLFSRRHGWIESVQGGLVREDWPSE